MTTHLLHTDERVETGDSRRLEIVRGVSGLGHAMLHEFDRCWRAAAEPGEIARWSRIPAAVVTRLLPHAVLADVRLAAGIRSFHVRMAGESHVALLGRNIAGETLHADGDDEAAALAAEMEASALGVPVRALVPVSAAEGFGGERVSFPLSRDGREVERVIALVAWQRPLRSRLKVRLGLA
jgi:hypothetical protein